MIVFGAATNLSPLVGPLVSDAVGAYCWALEGKVHNKVFCIIMCILVCSALYPCRIVFHYGLLKLQAKG